MLVIRFSRTGKKKQPYYRIIISEKHKDPWGNYLELLGTYNPRTKETELKADRIKYWISVGAQPSNTVHNLLVKQNVIEGDKKKSVKVSKKRLAKKDKKEKENQAQLDKKEKTKEAKVEEKVEEPKAEEAKVEEKVEEPKAEEAKVEEKVEEPKKE